MYIYICVYIYINIFHMRYHMISQIVSPSWAWFQVPRPLPRGARLGDRTCSSSLKVDKRRSLVQRSAAAETWDTAAVMGDVSIQKTLCINIYMYTIYYINICICICISMLRIHIHIYHIHMLHTYVYIYIYNIYIYIYMDSHTSRVCASFKEKFIYPKHGRREPVTMGIGIGMGCTANKTMWLRKGCNILF